VRRGWLSVFSTLAIGCVWLAAPLRAQFAYVANDDSNNASAYSIGANGALVPVPGSPFKAGSFPISVAVDPTGKFAYVANYDNNTVSAYSIAANGALTPVPGSPFTAGPHPVSVAITPLVPFASSFAKLEILLFFGLEEHFTLGATSNGINPVKEKVTLQIGKFSTTIPAGSFTKTPEGTYVFLGGIKGGGLLDAQIVPLGNKIYTLNAQGIGVDLTGLTKPVTVVLTIGINSGSTTVKAQFQLP
jgi:DNA-binding beta-propeller fold protein YncE